MPLYLNPIAPPLVSRAGRSRAAILIPILALAAGAPAQAGPLPKAAAPGSLGSCLNAVANGKASEISCDYEALLTEEERSDLRRISRGLLQDASCLVAVRIARPLVVAALTLPDHVFEAPPQPVRCMIKTRDGGFPVTSTFAPRVVFKAGLAVEATPGLGAVAGINRYLAWPIVQYVNRASGIQANMLAMINDLRPKLASATAK